MNLSLCCIWEGGDSTFKNMGVGHYKKQGKTELSARILHNFRLTKRNIELCAESGIRGYRMSSNLWCCIAAPEVNLQFRDLPQADDIFAAILQCGIAARENDIRLSFHPSEYISLTSLDDNVVKNSIIDLELHAEVMDMMGCNQSFWNPINIHIRQSKGDPDEIYKTFKQNYGRLSNSVRSRLVIENNDTGGVWSVGELCSRLAPDNIPCTFDTLHHKILPGNLTEKEAFFTAYQTWPETPLFHFSCGKNNSRNHADYADCPVPEYGVPVYWDCELKAKNLAILQILNSN